LLQPVPDRDQLARQRKRLRVGQQIAIDDIIAWLLDLGFQRREALEIPGEFSIRGGILDIFSPDAEAPYRLEFFGDEIESIRQFAVDTQRSLGDVQAVEITAAGEHQAAETNGQAQKDTGHLVDYLPPDAWVALVEPD